MSHESRWKTALVTGASAGIGRELVIQLTRDRGLTVLATARRLDRLQSLQAECPPGLVRILPGDLADAAFRERLWQEAETLPGGCDLLFNNAGLGHYGPLAEQSLESIEHEVAINVVALVDLTRQALASMTARNRGQIIEIASILGFFGIPYSSVYVATKFAVIGLVRSLRSEVAGTRVRVWAACPGRTTSEFSSVAAGCEPMLLSSRDSEPVDRVARGILQGLDRRRTCWVPTWQSWSLAKAATWLSLPFDAVMARWGPAVLRKQIATDRAAGQGTGKTGAG